MIESSTVIYQQSIRRQALKTLQRMPSRNARCVRSELAKLIEDPQRQEINVMRLQGRPGFRLRSGNWRVIFEQDEEKREINILRIGLRGDIYKQ